MAGEESYPRKYWWVVLVVVPLVGAVVAVLPGLLGGGGDGGQGGDRIDIQGSTIGGDVQIIGAQVILQQVGGGEAEVDDAEVREKVERAVNLVKGGLYEEATRLFEEVAGQVASPALYNNLGTLYLLQDRFDEAQAALGQGIASDPDFQPLHVSLARVYERRGNLDAAMAQLRKAPDEPAASAMLQTLESRSAAGAHEREPNDDGNSPNLLPLAQVVQGGLGSEEDVDFYRFEAPPAPRDWLTVSVVNGDTEMRPQVAVLRHDKSVHFLNAEYAHEVSAGQDVRYRFVPRSGATYFVRVGAFSGSGRYDVSVTPERAFDAHEPNDATVDATRIEPGTVVEASLLDEDDVDHYEVPAGGRFSVQVENRAIGLKPSVQLRGASKERVWRNAEYGYEVTAGQDVHAAMDAPRGASWYISVASFAGSGDYALKVTSE